MREKSGGFVLEDPICEEFVKPKGRVRKAKKMREYVEDEEKSLASRMMEKVPVHWEMLEQAEENVFGEDVLEMEVSMEERDVLEPRVLVEKCERVELEVTRQLKSSEDVQEMKVDEGKNVSESMSTEEGECELQVVLDEASTGGRRVKKLKKIRKLSCNYDASEDSEASSRKKRRCVESVDDLDVASGISGSEVMEVGVVDGGGGLDAGMVGQGIKEALGRLKDLIDKIEDEGARKKLVRKCRREVDEVTEKVGILVGMKSKVENEKVMDDRADERRVSEYEGLRVDLDVGKMKPAEVVTVDEGVSKVVESRKAEDVKVTNEESRMDDGAKGEDDESKIEKWLKWKWGVGKEDLKVVFFDCGEGWSDRDLKEGLWKSVMSGSSVKREEVERIVLERRLKDKSGKHGMIYRVNFPMMVALMTRVERKACVRGRWCRFDIYVDATCCWRCQRYGHRAVACESSTRCRNCGDGHGMRECKSEARLCVCCGDVGLVAVGHRAGSSDCVLHKRLLERKRVRMEGVLQYFSDMKWRRPLAPGEETKMREQDYKRVSGRF